MFTDNVIDIRPYIQKRDEEEAEKRLNRDVLDIIEDLTRYVDAYKLILEN